MDANRLRNLAFLMSLGGLSCFQDDGPRTSTGAGTGGTTGTTTGPDPTSDSSTSVPLTDGGTTTTTGTTEAPATTSTTEPTTTTLTGTTGTDSGTDTTSTTGAVPTQPICVKYGYVLTICFPDYRYIREAIEYCNYTFAEGIAEDGPACTAALEDFYVCINDLPCDQVDPELTNPTICAPQSDAVGAACPHLEP